MQERRLPLPHSLVQSLFQRPFRLEAQVLLHLAGIRKCILHIIFDGIFLIHRLQVRPQLLIQQIDHIVEAVGLPVPRLNTPVPFPAAITMADVTSLTKVKSRVCVPSPKMTGAFPSCMVHKNCEIMLA